MKQITHHTGLLILRVLAGLMMASHGYGKIFNGRMEGFTETVAEMGFPFPAFFAWAAALSELLGGLLLAAGLATRVAAFFIFCTMSVAAFIRHAPDPFSVTEKSLLYWTIALSIIFIGAGKYSIDYLIRKKK